MQVEEAWAGKQLAQAEEEVGWPDFSGVVGEVLALIPGHGALWEEAVAVPQGLTSGEVAVAVALEALGYGWVVLEERTPFALLGKVEAPQTGVDYHP